MRRHLLVVPFVGVLIASSSHAEVAPSKPSDIIDAFNSGTPCKSAPGTLVDQVVHSDGTAGPLTIPTDHVLVITSVDWRGTGTPNRHHFFTLTAETASGAAGVITGAGAQADGQGNVSGAVQIPDGIVIKRGVKLCPRVRANDEFPAFVRVHGFFTDDR
jgi:hypothetical protein